MTSQYLIDYLYLFISNRLKKKLLVVTWTTAVGFQTAMVQNKRKDVRNNLEQYNYHFFVWKGIRSEHLFNSYPSLNLMMYITYWFSNYQKFVIKNMWQSYACSIYCAKEPTNKLYCIKTKWVQTDSHYRTRKCTDP